MSGDRGPGKWQEFAPLPSNTVLVCGNFNVVHPGHLRLLRFAKDLGDTLVVGVFSDVMAADAAYVSQEFRLDAVRSISWVTDAFIIDEPAEVVVDALRPSVLVKGKEHEGQFNPEAAVVEEYGGRLVFSSGEVTFSSLDLLRQEFRRSAGYIGELPSWYAQRHGLDPATFKDRIDSFASLKVLVVGDLIVDEYVTCDALGMSQEDPTLVVTPIDTTRFVGGAGVVAGHAAALGASVSFVSAVGGDAMRDFAAAQLRDSGVDAHLIVDDSRPTTLKQRFRCHGKTLLRVSHLRQDALAVVLQQQLLKRVQALIDECDLLIFSDFNYGCLPDSLVADICAAARGRDIVLAADSQSSSQVGDIARFRGMDLITPTEYEVRLSLRDRDSGLAVLAYQLLERTQSRHLLLTLGEEGLLIQTGDASGSAVVTDRLPALNLGPRDTAGGGDCLLTVGAMTLATGGDIWEAAALGSVAAAIQVGRVGNQPLSADELRQEV